MMAALGLEKKTFFSFSLLKARDYGSIGQSVRRCRRTSINSYLAGVGFDYGEALSGISSELIF